MAALEKHKDLGESRRSGTQSTLDISDTRHTPKPNVTVHKHSLFTRIFFKTKYPPVPDVRGENPKNNANPFSIATFAWIAPLIKTGFTRVLEINDIPQPAFRELCIHRNERYRKRLLHYKNSGKQVAYKEFWAMAYAMRFRFLLAVLTVACFVAAELSLTVVSRYLIAEASLIYQGKKSGHAHAVGLVFGSTILSLGFQILMCWFGYQTRYFAELVRTMVIAAVYDKVMKLSPSGRQQFSASKITAIITTDTNRIHLCARWTPLLVLFFPVFGGLIGVLYSYIGISSLPGCGLVALGMVCNLFLSRLINYLRRRSIPYADRRIGVVRETIENMRVVKFYGWELSFVNLISVARNTEAGFLKILALVEGFADALTTTTPQLAGLLAFAVRLLVGGSFVPELVFPALGAFQLFIPLSIFFTTAINTHADAWTSLKRLNEFFQADEEECYVQQLPESSENAVVIENASFSWEPKHVTKAHKKRLARFFKRMRWANRVQDGAVIAIADRVGPAPPPNELLTYEEEQLQEAHDREARAGSQKFPGLLDLNLTVKRGQFVMVVGSIGTGKTSLISTIVGNIIIKKGSVHARGKVSSVLSNWSQNATIRENILFGQAYDPDRYAEVVSVCNLEADFASFPSRDFVEIGERGITLSGGQKARIALARCVYSGGDIILLDDVLSAVDGKVAQSIFDNCIQGYLKDRTRIMSTHNLKLLQHADTVVYLDGHGTSDIGTLAELMDRNAEFKEMYLSGINRQVVSEDEALSDTAVSEQDSIEQIYEGDSNEKFPVIQAQRQLSKAPDVEEADAHLMTEENRTKGTVPWKVIIKHFQSGHSMGLYFIIFIVLSLLVVGVASLMFSVFLDFWSGDKYNKSHGFYVGMYAVIIGGRFAGFLCLVTTLAIFCFNSSSNMHNNAVANLYRAPISYFDQTPLGRIINRFTDDTANLDTQLYMILRVFSFSATMLVATFVVIFVYVPYVILALLPVILCAVVFYHYYRKGGREIKRINSLFRSKMFTHITETISGLSVIVNSGRAQEFQDIVAKRIDDMNLTFSLTIGSQYWMSLRVVVSSSIVVFLTLMLSIFQVFNISASNLGMLLSILPNITISLSMCLPLLAEVENQFNSVERLYELAYEIPQEAAYHVEATKPSENWPQGGSIQFMNVRLRYRPELPEVLKGINFDIKPGEKIGIVGRTGAGKSTILSSLFRLNELSGGKILIDDVDISTLGLEDLRLKLAIIPQDPVLFEGSIRFNLDPFSNHTDHELWEALRRSGVIAMNEIVNGEVDAKHKFHLDTHIDSDGSNLSLGERQLLTLARALVRKARIIALDEATASVDYRTDQMIQETIMREFKDCTVLSIAHRLKTIINYDRVMVMDQGLVSECGRPLDLFQTEGSAFKQMVLDSGLSAQDFNK